MPANLYELYMSKMGNFSASFIIIIIINIFVALTGKALNNSKQDDQRK